MASEEAEASEAVVGGLAYASPDAFLPYVKCNEAEVEVRLSSLSVTVSIIGLYSETTQVMRFYNPNSRVLEGELSFPMAPGAVVCGYALDIGDSMVDGVIVSKNTAEGHIGMCIEW